MGSARFPSTLPAYYLDVIVNIGIVDRKSWNATHEGKPFNGSEWPGGGRLSFLLKEGEPRITKCRIWIVVTIAPIDISVIPHSSHHPQDNDMGSNTVYEV